MLPLLGGSSISEQQSGFSIHHVPGSLQERGTGTQSLRKGGSGRAKHHPGSLQLLAGVSPPKVAKNPQKQEPLLPRTSTDVQTPTAWAYSSSDLLGRGVRVMVCQSSTRLDHEQETLKDRPGATAVSACRVSAQQLVLSPTHLYMGVIGVPFPPTNNSRKFSRFFQRKLQAELTHY